MINFATKSFHWIVRVYHPAHPTNAMMELVAKMKINAQVIMFARLEHICALIFHALVS